MKFGCCINNIQTIPSLAQIGYDCFEFSGTAIASMSDFQFDKLCSEAQLNSLPCIGINAYCSGIPAIVGDRVSNYETRQYAKAMVKRARSLGAKNIGIGAPKARILPDNYDYLLANKQCEDFLKITCEEAAKEDIVILLEAVCSRMCNYMTHTYEAVEMVNKLKLENLKIVLDFYNMELMGENISEGLQVSDYLLHTHISTSSETGVVRGFPLEDEIDKYREIFALLKKINYDISLSVEPSEFNEKQAAGCLTMLQNIYNEIYL